MASSALPCWRRPMAPDWQVIECGCCYRLLLQSHVLSWQPVETKHDTVTPQYNVPRYKANRL